VSNSVAARAVGRGRSRRLTVCALAAVASWVLSCLAMVFAPLAAARSVPGSRPVLSLGHVSAGAVGHVAAVGPWSVLVYALVGCAVVLSALAVRYVVRPAALAPIDSELGLRAARSIVEEHGEDSLSPFILRPDKEFAFAAGGVTAYRLFGRTAVVSGDPVAPRDSMPEVLGLFLTSAHSRGWRVALYGGSSRHLASYRSMGLRALCVGEEAVVDPARFTLEGRAVRKLRQSVHRVARRGWEITACEGREIGADLEREIEALAQVWRAGKRRLLGFAMAMGEFESGVRPRDLYLLARSPEGDLRAVMCFISHCGKLSLDTMRRVGETPNGLNEALVSRALEVARERGVSEVSLNYAGLGHLVRNGPTGGPLASALKRATLRILGRRFQMERLVRFNEKFSPEWRPRYLVYESRLGLPRTVIRVLQAEGYLPQRSRRRSASSGQPAVHTAHGLATAQTPTRGRIGL
jgi:lysyl-tRNA synthetase, class II